MKTTFLRHLAVLAVLFFAACASETDEEPKLEPKLSSIQTLIFDGSCATSSCHGASGHSGDLVLEAGKSHAQLVGVDSANDKAKADGLKRVVAGKPDASFLVLKVQKIADSAHGKPMPIFEPNGLPADQVAVIKQWIADGALDN